MIKAVIYDSDGMLTHGERFSDTYSKKYNLPIEIMTPFFTGPFKDCLIGKADLKEELENGWLEKWNWSESVDNLLAYWFSTGAKLDTEILRTISNVKARCLLATNQEKYRTNYLIEKFKYDTVFEKVFSSAYIGSKKPEGVFFDHIIGYLRNKDSSIEKESVLFWDDDLDNIHGAKDYGLQTIMFTDTNSYKEEMIKLGLL